MNNNDIKEFENQLQVSINTACEYAERVHYGIRMFNGSIFLSWQMVRLIDFLLLASQFILPLTSLYFGASGAVFCAVAVVCCACLLFWLFAVKTSGWIFLRDNKICFWIDSWHDQTFSKDKLAKISDPYAKLEQFNYRRLKEEGIDPVKLYKFVLKFNSRQRKIISAARTFVLETKSSSQLDGLLSIAKDKVGGGEIK